ncbi:hypothetical protein AWC38_SpisGene4189 [Stylophora pistillata]|uniref:Uncharacterized protein n=1 Tax=Stylophora pistillata TaxID=50429 RepID=A0A2B4SPH6_STYPI|nr:hypothetical protein AWC38_SpisGene4189 [Stylophora pistillata]
MEPAASNETAKQENDGDGADPEEPIEEDEFQRCSRKGRRDACPDIHCKCGDSKQSGRKNLETAMATFGSRLQAH